jgi:hypothetical protein
MNEHLNNTGIEHVEPALIALRDASRNDRAPDHMESALLQAFRTHHQPALSRHKRRHAWFVAAIAASLLIVVATRLSKPPGVNAPDPPAIAKVPAPELVVAEVPHEAKAAPPRSRRVGPPRRKTPVVTASVPARRELTTDFFAIPYAPALTHVDRGQLIRVNVPATSMRSFGLPVSEERLFDRVQADVLMGEDGLARAIRFVRQPGSGLNYR